MRGRKPVSHAAKGTVFLHTFAAFNCIMNHSTSKILHILDAFLDFFLLLGTYEVTSLLRMHSPWGEAFWWVDVARFRPLALVYAAAIILIYIAQGEYRTFKRRGLARELAKALLGNLGGFALAATILYVFHLSQFSRLLLVYYYLLSSVVITIKRLLLHRISLWYAKRRHIIARVLLVGNGNLALRYYNDVVKGKDVSAEYAGYAAQNPVVELPNYLGTVADLHKILESTRITHIVIAEETQNRSELLQITAIAENYGIKVSVIPVYSDFLSSRTMDNTVNGLYVIDLKMQETCDIMGVNIVVTDMDKTMTLLESQLEQWRGKYICVANVHTTVTAHEDAEYRYIQNHAVMALPDGGPLSQFSRRQGYAAAQRVTGPDLMKQVLAVSAEKGWRHYFYGSTPETLQLLRKKVEERYPGVVISGMMSPPFREMTPQEDAQAVAEINATKPDFVWVGLGAPKQERWMAAHEDRVQALMIGVGAAFDYEAGNIKRAPMWMQKHNLEWLYRLMQDPKRLFHRYLKTNVKYLLWTWRSGE